MSAQPDDQIICLCGDSAEMHDLNSKGKRTACSRYIGPDCTPCGCRKFTPTLRRSWKLVWEDFPL